VVGWPLAAIAAVPGRHRATIWREVQRNRNHRKRYEGHPAHCLATTRRSIARRNQRFTADDRACIDACLEQQWSPEQISLRFAVLDIQRISPSTIYTRLYQKGRQPGSLWHHLAGASAAPATGRECASALGARPLDSAPAPADRPTHRDRELVDRYRARR
jgi:IS30 family transposase